MNHEEIMDLLEGYVDETLDRATRKLVDAHLAECEECRAILDDVARVELGDIAGAWDERGMRRAVRRSMLRVAADALLLLFAGWLAAWLLSMLVLQPLIVNRGGRAVAATTATVDLAVMSNPGAVVDEYLYDSQWASRTTSVEVSVPVGSGTIDLGTVESRIGILGFGDATGGQLLHHVSDESAWMKPLQSLRAASEGTVATVEVWFEPVVDVDAAEMMIGTPADVSVVWAGFRVSDGHGPGLAPSRVLGYGTCYENPITVNGASGSGGGSSGTFTGGPRIPASVSGALEETRRAIVNLVDHPEILEGIGASTTEAMQALRRLDRPAVAALVVTGPTTEILRFIDQVGPQEVSVIEIDFMNWSAPPCGR